MELSANSNIERKVTFAAPMSKPPLRPATPIDAELAEPGPDEETEIGKANKLAEKNKKPPHAVDIDEEASPPPKRP